jgi:hypothetical protein
LVVPDLPQSFPAVKDGFRGIQVELKASESGARGQIKQLGRLLAIRKNRGKAFSRTISGQKNINPENPWGIHAFFGGGLISFCQSRPQPLQFGSNLFGSNLFGEKQCLSG